MRNLDRRSRADFVKAYMHNGYLNSLREVVYFCNTGERASDVQTRRSWREGNVLASA
jgi:cytochrome c peroxidase